MFYSTPAAHFIHRTGSIRNNVSVGDGEVPNLAGTQICLDGCERRRGARSCDLLIALLEYLDFL